MFRSNIPSRIKLYEEAVERYRMIKEDAEKARQEADRVRLKNERILAEAERARQEAEQARRRTLKEFWMSLGGPEFEQELGTFFRHLGYQVQSTPTSGDEGIDLIIRKDGEKTVVQCKSHKAPVGPAIVRELYGSMVASGAKNAILACTGGFTKGVIEFAKGKPIELISASELAMIADEQEDNDKGVISSKPICPIPGCGREMNVRQGKYGSFWGCPAYPRCKGTRLVWKF